MRRFPGLLAVVGASAVLRLLHLRAVASSPFFAHPVLDGAYADEWARAVLAGAAPAAPFYQDPLHPHLLALLYRLFGPAPLPVHLLQVLFGVGVAACVYGIAWLAFDRRTAVLAGLGAALYRPFIFYDGLFEKTSLTLFLVALWLWLAALALRRRGPALALAAGAVLGAACLTRGNLLAFVPLFPLVFLPTRTLAACALAGSLAVVGPVAARNSLVGGELLLTTTMLGQNLYAGNNPGNLDGQNGTPPWVRTAPEFEETDFAAQAEAVSGRRLTPGEVSAFYARSALAWAASEPGAWARLLLRKAALFVSRHEVPDNQDIGFFGRYSGVLRLPLPGFGLVFALGLPGLLLCGRSSPVRRALAIFLPVYALSTVLFFVLSRYRVVSVPALLPFAAAFAWRTLDAAAAARRGGSWRPLAAACVAALAAFGLTLLPVRGVPAATAGAQTLANLGAALHRGGDVAGAERAFLDAIALDPALAGAWRSLGVSRYRRGERAGAFAALREASRLRPDDAVSRYYLGTILEERGELAAAEALYAEAARLLPARADFRAARDRIARRRAAGVP